MSVDIDIKVTIPGEEYYESQREDRKLVKRKIEISSPKGSLERKGSNQIQLGCCIFDYNDFIRAAEIVKKGMSIND